MAKRVGGGPLYRQLSGVREHRVLLSSDRGMGPGLGSSSLESWAGAGLRGSAKVQDGLGQIA